MVSYWPHLSRGRLRRIIFFPNPPRERATELVRAGWLEFTQRISYVQGI